MTQDPTRLTHRFNAAVVVVDRAESELTERFLGMVGQAFPQVLVAALFLMGAVVVVESAKTITRLSVELRKEMARQEAGTEG